MITKEGLITRLEKENIKVYILDFDYEDIDNSIWFAFSFEDGHELGHDGSIDPDTEDDALVFLRGDDDDYAEAINAIKFSRLNPTTAQK